jgi:hypothetical protein
MQNKIKYALGQGGNVQQPLCPFRCVPDLLILLVSCHIDKCLGVIRSVQVRALLFYLSKYL